MAAVRHLTESFADAALRRGAAIAQWIPDSEVVDGRATIAWLQASRRRDGKYVLSRHHVFDDGSPSFVDVWEFSPVGERETHGVGVDLAAFDSGQDLLRAAAEEWGADRQRWVNDGVIQDEYRDSVHR
jgi:hypothetical protein